MDSEFFVETIGNTDENTIKNYV